MRLRAVWTGLLLLPLVGCGRQANGAPALEKAPGPEPEQRRLLVGSEFNFYVEAPSPDGRHLTDVDWRTGDLALRELDTGELRRVTAKGPWRTSDDYAEYGAFSPDGSRIAYSWFKGQLGRPEGTQTGYELRTIGVDGSDMRVHLPAREDVRYIVTEDWSPDGSQILVTVSREDRTSQIGLVSVADDDYRILKSTDWRTPATAAFSPDGRWIVYDFPPEPGSRTRDIFALAVDGSREIPLVEGPGHERLMGWLPDGSGILFHRDADGSKSLYRQRVRDGRAVGAPELVKRDAWSVIPFGFSRDAFFYGVTIETPQPHVVMVDLEAGRALSEPEPLESLSAPSSGAPAWSPDGQSLAYLSSVPGMVGKELVVRSVSGETVNRVHLPLDPVARPHWVGDGFAVAGTDPDGKVGWWRVDLESGGVRALFEAEPGMNIGDLLHHTWSPDGRILYFRRVEQSASALEDWSSRLVAHDVESGEERVLARLGRGRRMSVSPDGRWIAVHALASVDSGGSTTGLYLVPAEGGDPRLIHTIGPDRAALHNQGGLPFTPDGSHLVWVEWERGEEGASAARRSIWLVPVDGSGARPLMDLVGLQGMNLSVSPDGRRLAFAGGQNRGEIWRMSGFDRDPVDAGSGSEP